ncbi:tRNA methyltransferase 10 homolog A [Centruroides vittatus]|uniref:tRNA methyltransferase 10 homolog A n=1 Tax=Centruroides vittatus TaxID=120091 RepID=UPI00350F6ABB
MDSSNESMDQKDCDINVIQTQQSTVTTLSKRQQKKIAKREKWLAQKSERRAKEREKRKRKQQEAREKGIKLGPNRKELKMAKMEFSTCRIKVAIDLSLNHLMTDAEMSKTLKQLHRCYYLNRRSSSPLQLYITSVDNAVKQRMTVNAGCLNWDVYYKEENYLDVFGVNNTVYLTSESDNIVDNLEESKTYIIGGLVDHNRHKGICHKLAMEKGSSHARLPLDKYLIMKTRNVLTIDQVFEILLRVAEGLTWQESFLKVLPKRKGAIIKEAPNSDLEKSKEND